MSVLWKEHTPQPYAERLCWIEGAKAVEMAKVRPKRRATYSVEQKLTALSEEDRVDEEFMFVWKYSIEVLLGCSETTDVALGGTNALTSLCVDVIFRESQSNSLCLRRSSI